MAVDARAFYAIDNTTIAKYDKKSGALVKRWTQEKNGPLIHLDGGMVHEGRLYAAHSNYPAWPMTSSLEIFDTATLAHVGSHSFGINWGSLTWADFHAGFWWMVPVPMNGCWRTATTCAGLPPAAAAKPALS